MILRRLAIEGFGRFRQRTLELDPGLNVLFGPNEAGKSTLHAFLDGMLFGFRQTRTQQGHQRSRRAYTPERERYRPWDGGGYAGSLVYEQDGRTLLVRRDFAQDTLAIQDAVTGRDLTAEFDLDPVTGERDFARRHAGLTPLTFRNTLSVGQAAAALDRGALAPEIRDLLIQSGSTAGAGAPAAIDVLRDALDRVGTARRATSPLGQAQARVAELSALRERALASLELTRALETVQARLEEARASAQAAQAARDRLELARAASRLRQALALRAEIEAIPPFPTTQLDELASRQRAVQDAERAEAAEAEAARARARDAAAAEAAMPPIAALAPARLAEVRRAWQEAEDLQVRAGQARARRERLRQLAAIGDDPVTEARRLEAAARPGPPGAMAASGVVVLLAGVAVRIPWLAALGALATAAGLWRWLAARRSARSLGRLLAAAGAEDLRALSRLDDERRLLRAQPDEDPTALAQAAADQEGIARAILEEIGAQADDLQGLELQVEQGREAAEARRRAAERRQEQAVRLRAAERAATAARADLMAYLVSHGVATAEAFRAGAEAAARREMLQARLETLLAGARIEELAARFPEGLPPAAGAAAPATPASPAPGAHGQGADAAEPTDQALADAHAAWLAAMDDLQRLREEEAALRQRIGPAPPDLGAVEAELRQALRLRGELTARQEGLALALATIEEVQQAAQREFAPVLHRRLAELAPGLSAGRYSEIHVDEDLNVTVRVPERSDLVPAELLSRGAMDQIYLAARLALAEVATGGAEAPLLLDDSLVHFDDDRLAAALSCLGELAADRQILLFTCHGRVLAALQASGAAHRLVRV